MNSVKISKLDDSELMNSMQSQEIDSPCKKHSSNNIALINGHNGVENNEPNGHAKPPDNPKKIQNGFREPL